MCSEGRNNESDMILYNTDDGQIKIELHLKDRTIWLTDLEIAELFQTTRQNINKHIKVIIADKELDEEWLATISC